MGIHQLEASDETNNKKWLSRILNSHLYIVTILGCDYRRGINWILDLLIQFGAANNYSAIADYTLQITAGYPAGSVFNSCFLVMDGNSGDSSASRAKVILVCPTPQQFVYCCKRV
jgi:hypothetical protein